MFGDEADEDAERGPICYQERKEFHSAHGLLEPHLINVYDNTVKRFVTFEIYGLDTQNLLRLVYQYPAFDNLFRFNAELMNPNRKEGRFHWIIERLEISTATKERKLKLAEKCTEQISQLPLYETTRKIPTGRMDLKERQRLREQMDILDVRRAENIQKKRAAALERFLKHVFALKEEDKRRKEEQQQKMEEERGKRYKSKEEMERLEEEELKALEKKNKLRRKAVEVKEQRTEEQEEYELRQLRLRWKAAAQEKNQLLEEARTKRGKEKKDATDAKGTLDTKRETGEEKRHVYFKQLQARVKAKDDGWLKKVLEKKADVKRHQKVQRERNQEYITELFNDRQPIFKAQLQRTAERKLARDAEEEAVNNYHAKRSLPKKEKTKGKHKKKVQGGDEDAKAKTKKKAKDKDKDGGKAADVEHVEKVLDEVEAKMRQEMEEEKRRARLHGKREECHTKAREERVQRENEHMKEVRDTHRKNLREEAKVVEERRLIVQQRHQEMKAAEERKKENKARLARARDAMIERREEAFIARTTAGG